MLARFPESKDRATVLRMHLLLGLLGTAVAGLVLTGDISITNSIMYTPSDPLHWVFFWAFLSFSVVAPFVLAAPGVCLRDFRLTVRGILAGILLGILFAFMSVPEFVWVDPDDRKILLRFAGLFVFASAISALSVFLATRSRDAAIRAALRAPLLAVTAIFCYAFVSNMFNRMWSPTHDVYLPMRVGIRFVVEGLIFSVLPLAVALEWIPLSQRAARQIWWVLFSTFALHMAVVFTWPNTDLSRLGMIEMALFPTYIYWFWDRLNWAQRVLPVLPAIFLLSLFVITYWSAR